MPTADAIAAALRQRLPAEHHPAIPALAQVLADATAGARRPEQAQARLAADPQLAAALRALAGRELDAGGSVIAFGAGAQKISRGWVGRSRGRTWLPKAPPNPLACGRRPRERGQGVRASGL